MRTSEQWSVDWRQGQLHSHLLTLQSQVSDVVSQSEDGLGRQDPEEGGGGGADEVRGLAGSAAAVQLRGVPRAAPPLDQTHPLQPGVHQGLPLQPQPLGRVQRGVRVRDPGVAPDRRHWAEGPGLRGQQDVVGGGALHPALHRYRSDHPSHGRD